MLVSEKLAIAAHLHVLLRRKTGRVTDTEWMAENREYALEIVRFSRAKAATEGLPELEEWAGKLERATLETGTARRTWVDSAVPSLRGAAHGSGPAEAAERTSGFGESRPDGEGPRDPDTPRYVGGIR